MSITLDGELVHALDALAGPAGNRSHLVETAVREFVERRRRIARDARDRNVLDQHSDELSDLMDDVLSYQAEPRGEASSTGFAGRAGAPSAPASSSS